MIMSKNGIVLDFETADIFGLIWFILALWKVVDIILWLWYNLHITWG
jgi:hypothetical protein